MDIREIERKLGQISMGLIGILYNSKSDTAGLMAADVGSWLEQLGYDVWSSSTDGLKGPAQKVARSSLVIVLGGDGTTLLAARLAASAEVPIFGINLGRVGFLSEASPSDWRERLTSVLNQEHWIEKRLMLRAQVKRQDQILGDMMALNDVVVSRGAHVRVVRFHLYVDGDHVTTYTADGLITATPTGSTAYSMAAGGPLLPPQLQNYVVLPVAPHLSFERPLVLHQEAIVKIRVEMSHEAIATADGKEAVNLSDGDEVIISKHSCMSSFARVDGPSYFYLRLMRRLSYWSRKQ